MRFLIRKPRTIFHDTTWKNPIVKIHRLGLLEKVIVEFEDCMVTIRFDSVIEAVQVLNNILRQIKEKEMKK